MKKILLMAVMCLMTMSAMAQIKSVEVKANLRGDFGIGAGLTIIFEKKELLLFS